MIGAFGSYGPGVPVTYLDPTLERVLDLAGVFAFALSGASLAVRRGFDVVGLGFLAITTGLGGGLLRDALIGDVPPVALRHQEYLLAPLAAAGIALIGNRYIERARRPVLVFDAMGLGLFCVVGTAKSLDFGASTLAAVLLGILTAVGGGIFRDVLAREVPSVFQPVNGLYAVPAAAGAGAVAALWSADAFNAATATGVVAGVVTFRLLAMHFEWRAPSAR